MRAPYRSWPDGRCKVCTSPENAEHEFGCWVTDSVDWLRSNVGVGENLDPLTQWWLEVATAEAKAVVPKAIEYGATDLNEIGRTLGQAMGRSFPSPMEEAELGVFFYILGKMARWTDAIKTGRSVSDDTLHDIGVYIRMAQRIRAAGGWPGIELEERK